MSYLKDNDIEIMFKITHLSTIFVKYQFKHQWLIWMLLCEGTQKGPENNLDSSSAHFQTILYGDVLFFSSNLTNKMHSKFWDAVPKGRWNYIIILLAPTTPHAVR